MLLKKFLFAATAVCMAAGLSACSDDNDGPEDKFDDDVDGLFVICEGMWGYGNASVSFLDTENMTVENEVFQRANGFKLGDTAQSMTIHDDLAWIVVNTSGVVYAMDEDTYKEKGRVEGLVSPRFLHFVSDSKAYLTDMYSSEVFILNPRTYTLEGSIIIDSPGERMVQSGKYVYVNSWSYGHTISKIDTTSDRVVATLEVGVQPKSMVIDANKRLWVLCDGGAWPENPAGYEAPTLVCVNLVSFEVEKTFTFTLGDSVSNLCIDGDGRNLYWLNGGVYTMGINATSAPTAPVITRQGVLYYGLTVNPENGDIYISDAVDYQQSGAIYRYSSNGTLLDSFTVGVCPSAFCWKL